jgi:Domain of unknown function (DUF4160)
MPEICRFFEAIITMNFREHNPPHFHVTYGDDEALIGINDLRTLEGKLPKRIKAAVLEWADEHRQELIVNWNLAQARKLPKKIKPLE